MDIHIDPKSRIGREEPVIHKVEPPIHERIGDWMARTLGEMKRQTGWFKENPTVASAKEKLKMFPQIQSDLDANLQQLNHQADVAFEKAQKELKGKIETPEEDTGAAIRFIKPAQVDFNDQKKWMDFKIQIITEFENAFSDTSPQPNDIEVTTFSPTENTTLGDMRDNGPKKIHVRSESIGGVRIDGVLDPAKPDQYLEYRVYDLEGWYITIPAPADPVDRLLKQAKYNIIRMQYLKKDKTQEHRFPLATPEDYQLPLITKNEEQRHTEPAIGSFKNIRSDDVRQEPAVELTSYPESSVHIPSLIRHLRDIRVENVTATQASHQAEMILSSKGSQPMIDITLPFLRRLAEVRSASASGKLTYRKGLVALLQADTLDTRQQVIDQLRAELPVPAPTSSTSTIVKTERRAA